MILGKDIVIVKGDKDTPTQFVEYDRVYLEYGPADSLEPFGKTCDGKDVVINGKVWQGLRPTGASKTPIQDLLEQALNYFSENWSKDNPFQVELEAMSKQADLWIRNKISADTRPSKPLDMEAAVAKSAALFMKMNPKLSLARATELARAASIAE